GYWTNALNTAVSNAYPYYNWIGFTNANSPYQALLWFGVPINPVDVKEVGGTLPQEFSISQNYPNPFNPTTKINFSVPRNSLVTLKVYDVLGKEVATLVNGEMNSGNYEVDFNAANLASGLYIYKIQAGSFSSSMKMMLLK
ncbi:MAG: T9SS type A sorting domain-containing protein, partial [Ignavibacteria bacterium]|nr:T9SS type A sorting domain-containing protein [Ignavibacteria bacterium]